MARTRVLGVLGGLLAAAAGVTAAEGVSAAIGGSSPVVAVGTWTIDHAPYPLVHFAIETFGAADKPVLVAGILTTLVFLAAFAGWMGVRRPARALALTAALGVVGVLAAATVRGSTDSVGVRVAPGVVALLVSTGGLALMLRTLRRPDPEAASTSSVTFAEDERELGSVTVESGEAGVAAGVGAGRSAAGISAIDRPTGPGGGGLIVPERPAVIIPGRRPGDEGYDRRGFLHAAGAVGTLGVAGAIAWRAFSIEPGFDSRLAVRAPRPDSAAKAVAGADFQLPNVTPYFTPTKDFYRVDTSIIVPRVDARKWRLRIHGMVENPIELSYADLMSRKLIERDITLACVSNEIGGDLVGNARWVGARIDEVLREARPLPVANAVKSTSVDGWTCGTPLSALTDGRDSIFAMTMNGEPLTYDHGFPVRMVVPGLYGYVSATKWVKDIEVTRFDRFQAYWTQRGWSAQGPIKTQTRVDVPVPFKDTATGRTLIAGVAWAQGRGISKVEIQVDDEPWRVAELARWNNADTWRQWRLEVDLKKGTHNIAARAYDGAGVLQTDKNAPSLPDGVTGYHNALVYAV